MSTQRILLGIALFALVTAVLYVWGLKKSLTQKSSFEHILLSKSAANVIQYLRKRTTITQSEMLPLVKGVKAGMFWSRKRAMVHNPKEFVPKLIRYMIEQQLIEDIGGLRYQLKK